jgi:LacI family transcriptional regulator
MKPKKKIAVVLNMFQHYDRGILHGIAAYAQKHQQWSIYAEEEETQKMPDLQEWRGDGLIASFDDPNVAKMVQGVSTPVVGIGGGQGWYDEQSGIPYVGTDDEKIGQLAAEHLLARGLTHFAFCGYPKDRTNVWVANRAEGFKRRLVQEGFECHMFAGRKQASQRWDLRQAELAAWLRTLPKPIGLMGCYDSRARHVLEACRFLGLRVPDDVAVIGVDNNELTCELSEPPLSSVEQGTFAIGYAAARLLDRMMGGKKPDQLRYCIEPVGVVSRQSTNLLNVADREVGIALRRIRDQACQGIQADALANELQLSRSTLDMRFKKAIGRTVDQEIRQVRLARAKDLLARTGMPLKEVAKEAGYGSEQYLARMIRDATHTTPARYRRDHQASRPSL